jgi:hypothetical protein
MTRSLLASLATVSVADSAGTPAGSTGLLAGVVQAGAAVSAQGLDGGGTKPAGGGSDGRVEVTGATGAGVGAGRGAVSEFTATGAAEVTLGGGVGKPASNKLGGGVGVGSAGVGRNRTVSSGAAGVVTRRLANEAAID